jgi:hypothetical protein
MTKSKLVVAATVLTLVVVAGRPARGDAPGGSKGKLFITKERLPESGDLAKASTAHLRELHQVWPTEERGNELTTWSINYVALLARPLGDFEAELKFWDVTKGPARFVHAEDQFTRHKDTRVLTGQVTVYAPEFERNHRYLVRVESRHVVLAEVTVWLRGTPPHYDGRADFTNEETLK